MSPRTARTILTLFWFGALLCAGVLLLMAGRGRPF